MIYVLDTCVFRKILDHLPRKGPAFKPIWDALEAAFCNGILVSVDEVWEELSRHFSASNENKN